MNQKIKILIATPLYPPDIGGPAIYSKVLLSELPRFGFDVDVLYFGEVRHMPKIIRHVVYFLKTIYKGFFVDIIFAQDPVSVGFPAMLAATVLHKKFVLKIVGDYAWEQGMQRHGVSDLLDKFLKKRYGIATEFLRKVEKIVAKRAKLIIVPSKYLKTVVEQWGIASQKIHVIYNDVSLPKTFFSHTEARKKLNITDSNIILVSAGRLVPWKGFATLIFCMTKIIHQHKRARLFIIGDGPEYGYLRDTIYALGLENNIYLLGKLSHDAVIKYLSAADIFALNTGYEGFSHQLLEAFALGAPTITTLCGGNAEIVRPNVNALIVAHNDRLGWENAMLKLCNDQELRAHLSRSAKEDAIKYSEGSMIKQVSSILKKYERINVIYRSEDF